MQFADVRTEGGLRRIPEMVGGGRSGANEAQTRRTAVSQGGLDGASEHLLRELAPQVLGSVVRRFHDFAAAEDAVQEALVAATLQWPQEGIPENPRRWLIQVAVRRMTDHL